MVCRALHLLALGLPVLTAGCTARIGSGSAQVIGESTVAPTAGPATVEAGPTSALRLSACPAAPGGVAFTPQAGVTYALVDPNHTWSVEVASGDDPLLGLSLPRPTFSRRQMFLLEPDPAGGLQVRALAGRRALLPQEASPQVVAATDANGSRGAQGLRAGSWQAETTARGARLRWAGGEMCLAAEDAAEVDLQLVPYKKGFAGWDDKWPSWVPQLRPFWLYNWGLENSTHPAPEACEFVPMLWGFYGDVVGLKADLAGFLAGGRSRYVLSYNEPDNRGQANLDVQAAISTWPYFLASGLVVGSPAATQAQGPWMQAFIKAVGPDAVGFLAVHWYGGADAKSLIAYLNGLWNIYHLPIWLTEFAPADWGAKSVADIAFTETQVRDFAAALLPALDDMAFVQRYAWFEAGADDAALGRSVLFRDDGSLTGAGRVYADHPFAPPASE